MGEKRLIYANEALRMLKNCRSDNPYFNGKTTPIWETALDCAISCVDACSTVDAVEVVHAEWICMPEDRNVLMLPEVYCCSVCGKSAVQKHNFCNRCGAKMDGGVDRGL